MCHKNDGMMYRFIQEDKKYNDQLGWNQNFTKDYAVDLQREQ